DGVAVDRDVDVVLLHARYFRPQRVGVFVLGHVHAELRGAGRSVVAHRAHEEAAKQVVDRVVERVEAGKVCHCQSPDIDWAPEAPTVRIWEPHRAFQAVSTTPGISRDCRTQWWWCCAFSGAASRTSAWTVNTLRELRSSRCTVSVSGTLSPGLRGCLRSVSMACSPPGASFTALPPGSSILLTARILMTP